MRVGGFDGGAHNTSDSYYPVSREKFSHLASSTQNFGEPLCEFTSDVVADIVSTVALGMSMISERRGRPNTTTSTDFGLRLFRPPNARPGRHIHHTILVQVLDIVTHPSCVRHGFVAYPTPIPTVETIVRNSVMAWRRRDSRIDRVRSSH